MQITIEAVVPSNERKNGKRYLRVRSVQERPRVPPPGMRLKIVDQKPPKLSVILDVILSTEVWKKGEEEGEVVATGQFEDLVHLAVVEGWEVVGGLKNLSPDQQDFVKCARGDCSEHTHSA